MTHELWPTVEVHDKAFARRGWVGDPAFLTVTPRHNALSTASFGVDAGHPRLADLTAPGARVVVRYDGQTLLSGRVRSWSAERNPVERFTFDVAGDFELLSRVLGWQVPGSAVGSQSGAEYRTVSGPAETVAKVLVQENAQRLGLPVTTAVSQGRGASITVQVRMQPLADRLLPLLDQAGVGLTVVQSGAGFLVDAYVPALHPRTLTEASGVVQDWSLSRQAPTVTRVVVGGPGEGTARVFRARADTTAESLWGTVVEGFVDARDIDEADVNRDALMDARGDQALAEGAAKSGLSVVLAETSTFRYGRAVKVGDRVALDVGTGLTVEDVLREAVLSWTREEGLRVVPVVGERTDDPSERLAAAVAGVARRQRNIEAGR